LLGSLDEDASGRVSKDEFFVAVTAAGFAAPRAELDAIFDQVDTDDSGTVSTKELRAVLEEGQWNREQEELEAELEEGDEELLQARGRREQLKVELMGSLDRVSEYFQASDTDGSGLIDAHEFAKAVSLLGLTASRETCDAVFFHYDVDGSRQMAYTEFMRTALLDALAGAATRVSDHLDSAKGSHEVGTGTGGGEEGADSTEDRHLRATAPATAAGQDLKCSSVEEEQIEAARLVAPSKGKSRRLKREDFLERVHERRAARQLVAARSPAVPSGLQCGSLLTLRQSVASMSPGRQWSPVARSSGGHQWSTPVVASSPEVASQGSADRGSLRPKSEQIGAAALRCGAAEPDEAQRLCGADGDMT